MTGTTWNPSDKGASITLYRGNMTAFQKTTNDAYYSVRATTSQSSGKWYFECTLAATEDQNLAGSRNGVQWFIGIGQSTASLTLYVGEDANGVGCQENGFVINNAASIGTWQGGFFGDVFGVAVDLTNHLIWVRNNRSSTWNTSGNPAAGTGGYTIPSGTYFPMWSAKNTGGLIDGGSANFGDQPFIIGAPSGFSAWDTNGVSRGAGGSLPTTLSVGANLTLSNGNMTIARGAGNPGNFYAAAGSSYYNTGKRYFEVQVNTLGGAGQFYAGLTTSRTGAMNPGDTVDGTGFRDDGGIYHHQEIDDGVVGGPLWAGCSQGDYIGFACDLDHGLVWAKASSSSTKWNNSVSNDPTNGTGGAGIAVAGDVYINLALSTNLGQVTLNTGSSSFNMTPPTGYIAWDASAVTWFENHDRPPQRLPFHRLAQLDEQWAPLPAANIVTQFGWDNQPPPPQRLPFHRLAQLDEQWPFKVVATPTQFGWENQGPRPQPRRPQRLPQSDEQWPTTPNNLVTQLGWENQGPPPQRLPFHRLAQLDEQWVFTAVKTPTQVGWLGWEIQSPTIQQPRRQRLSINFDPPELFTSPPNNLVTQFGWDSQPLPPQRLPFHRLPYFDVVPHSVAGGAAVFQAYGYMRALKVG